MQGSRGQNIVMVTAIPVAHHPFDLTATVLPSHCDTIDNCEDAGYLLRI